MFTGHLPFEHKVRDNLGFTLAANTPTLAGLFRAAGYRTGGFVSAYVLRTETGVGQGFEVYDATFPPMAADRSAAQVQRPGTETLAAADAWLNPQSSTATAAANTKGDAMIPKMLKLRCAGYGSDYTRADALKAAGVTIGGTLAIMLGLMWARARFGENPYLESLLMVSWLLPFLFSQRYTDLKGRSGRVQALMIGGPALIVIAIALSAAWINS